tara:strand:+ start:3653 stop:3769 length:117 start_codon:yes stop_codon:yes gene_type:complete
MKEDSSKKIQLKYYNNDFKFANRILKRIMRIKLLLSIN